MTHKIIALSGSLRKASYNTALLRAAQELAPKDMQIEIADISAIPLYSGDLEQSHFPESVIALAEKIRAADGILIATPEYNYSVPGVLKNTIDWLSRVQPAVFSGKPLAMMGASMGMMGSARAQYHLRQILVYLNPRVMSQPELFIATAQNKFDANLKLTDAPTCDFLGQFLIAFKAWK